MSVWTIEATIKEASLRSDGDLYLVIEAGNIRGCVEAPDPRGCKGSPFYEQIAQVRRKILDKVGGVLPKYDLNVRAKFMGIGFFGTAGRGDNGARLEPLLGVEWLP